MKMFFIYVHCMICIDCGCLSGVINDDDDDCASIIFFWPVCFIGVRDRLLFLVGGKLYKISA